MLGSYMLALRRSRLAITSVAATYAVSIGIGICAAHAGSQFALSQRDELVKSAQTGIVLVHHQPIVQALLDFSGNLLGAIGTTLLGFGIVLSYPMVAYRGWVGGIVSLDGSHASRLSHPATAFYYLSVIFLQILAFSLTGGAGVRVGLANLRPNADRLKWLLGLPRGALLDALRIYAIAIPIFLFASLWEFLSPLK